jgi:type I restriction-modification system DNA methylase subunit
LTPDERRSTKRDDQISFCDHEGPKHVVLGLIFLKYISDAFEAKHAELETQKPQGADPEDPDEYRAFSIFWVPKNARWSHLKDKAPPFQYALADTA